MDSQFLLEVQTAHHHQLKSRQREWFQQPYSHFYALHSAECTQRSSLQSLREHSKESTEHARLASSLQFLTQEEKQTVRLTANQQQHTTKTKAIVAICPL